MCIGCVVARYDAMWTLIRLYPRCKRKRASAYISRLKEIETLFRNVLRARFISRVEEVDAQQVQTRFCTKSIPM